MKRVGRHGNRDRYSADPGAVTQDVAVYIQYKRSPWCLKGGKVTVTVTPSLVCPRIRQREYRGMQRHPASKSDGVLTAARLGKTRTARKIRILRGYGKYATRIRHRGQRLDMLCRPLHGPLRIDKDAGADLEYFLWGVSVACRKPRPLISVSHTLMIK